MDTKLTERSSGLDVHRVLALDSAALAELLAGVASVRTPKRSSDLMSYSSFPPS